MAIDNLPGATVRIRRGRHGGRTGEVIAAFDHQAGPTASYAAIKVKLKGSGQPVMIYSPDELERRSELSGGSALPTAPPELLKFI